MLGGPRFHAMSQPDEVIILTDQECDPCQKLKHLLAEAPLVRFLELGSQEADVLLGDQHQVVVPMPIARFGEKREVCALAYEGEKVLLVCGEDTFPLKE